MTVRWTAEKWHKNFWCRLFGHRWDHGWFGSEPYLRPEYHATDGVGTEHLYLKCRCDRCGENHTLARLHVQAVEHEMERIYARHPHIRAMKHQIKEKEDA